MTSEKIEIIVCMGSACFARGNEQNLEFIEKYIKEHNLNIDIELGGSRCEGKCAEGPNMIVNGIEYNKINEEKIIEILEKLAEESA